MPQVALAQGVTQRRWVDAHVCLRHQAGTATSSIKSDVAQVQWMEVHAAPVELGHEPAETFDQRFPQAAVQALQGLAQGQAG